MDLADELRSNQAGAHNTDHMRAPDAGLLRALAELASDTVKVKILTIAAEASGPTAAAFSRLAEFSAVPPPATAASELRFCAAVCCLVCLGCLRDFCRFCGIVQSPMWVVHKSQVFHNMFIL